MAAKPAPADPTVQRVQLLGLPRTFCKFSSLALWEQPTDESCTSGDPMDGAPSASLQRAFMARTLFVELVQEMLRHPTDARYRFVDVSVLYSKDDEHRLYTHYGGPDELAGQVLQVSLEKGVLELFGEHVRYVDVAGRRLVDMSLVPLDWLYSVASLHNQVHVGGLGDVSSFVEASLPLGYPVAELDVAAALEAVLLWLPVGSPPDGLGQRSADDIPSVRADQDPNDAEGLLHALHVLRDPAVFRKTGTDTSVWECARCTYNNPADAAFCEVCRSPRGHLERKYTAVEKVRVLKFTEYVQLVSRAFEADAPNHALLVPIMTVLLNRSYKQDSHNMFYHYDDEEYTRYGQEPDPCGWLAVARTIGGCLGSAARAIARLWTDPTFPAPQLLHTMCQPQARLYVDLGFRMHELPETVRLREWRESIPVENIMLVVDELDARTGEVHVGTSVASHDLRDGKHPFALPHDVDRHVAAWRLHLQPEDRLDVLDTVSKWYTGTVRDVRDNRVFVHYDGWSAKFDEWIPLCSRRLAPFQSIALGGRTSGGVHGSARVAALEDPDEFPAAFRGRKAFPNTLHSVYFNSSLLVHFLNYFFTSLPGTNTANAVLSPLFERADPRVDLWLLVDTLCAARFALSQPYADRLLSPFVKRCESLLGTLSQQSPELAARRDLFRERLQVLLESSSEDARHRWAAREALAQVFDELDVLPVPDLRSIVEDYWHGDTGRNDV